MPEITNKVTINAAPQEVFEALTQAKNIAGWWTPDCAADQNVGGFVKVEFKASDGKIDGYTRLRIEKLIPGKLMEWKCVDQSFEGISDWVGTTIRFRLAENPSGGTDIDFAHVDWKNTQGSYQRCTDGWEFVLKTSLKNYVETGKGKPYLSHIEEEAKLKSPRS
jgi:uncharacterized protein YndB with AHSA1/START domain